MTSKSETTISFDKVIRQLNAGGSMPPELLEIFAEEADDHLGTIYDGLNRLQNDNRDATALADVRRSSHTLKGAAGAVNLQAATRLAHRMEDLLDLLANRKQGINEKQLALLLATADQLQALTTGDLDVETAAHQIVELYQGYSIEIAGSNEVANQKKSKPVEAKYDFPKDVVRPRNSAESDVIQSPAPGTPTVASTPTQYLRVPLNRLDDLVALLGEMIVNRSQLQQRLNDFESRIEDMQNTLQRLRSVAQFVENQRVTDVQQHRTETGRSQIHFELDSSTQSHDDPSETHGEFDLLEFERYTDFYLLAQTLSEADNDARIMSGEFRAVKTAFDTLLRANNN